MLTTLDLRGLKHPQYHPRIRRGERHVSTDVFDGKPRHWLTLRGRQVWIRSAETGQFVNGIKLSDGSTMYVVGAGAYAISEDGVRSYFGLKSDGIVYLAQ